MSKRKSVSLALLLAFSLVVAAPPGVSGSLATDETTAVAASDIPAEDDAPAADESESQPPQRKKSNSFARAITAPFRALGRLFGGGGDKGETAKKEQRRAEEAAKKQQRENEEAAKRQLRLEEEAGKRQRESEEAAKKQQRQAEEAARKQQRERERVQAQTKPRNEKPAKSPSDEKRAAALPSTLEHSEAVAPAVTSLPNRATDAGTRVVRPAEGSMPAPIPKQFIPVIEGVPRDPLSQGRALLQHGYPNEAISELSIAAMTVRPGANLIEANNLLGLAYDRLGMNREAAEAYRRALSVAPNDAVILANLGYSLYLSNDFNGALRQLKQAARISPGLAVVHNNIGIVQARLGKYDEAFDSFARATNKYEAHLKIAGILEFEKRDGQALKHYEAALKLQPGTSAVLERLIALYERTGQYDKALTARRALGQPQNPQRTTTGGGG